MNKHDTTAPFEKKL